MKAIILTTAILLATVLGISNGAYADTTRNEQAYTIISEVNSISKIEVHGNVQLYVSDGATDQVKVYNNYYKETAMVQDQNGTLRISSYKNEKLVVWVTVSDLRSLDVYDNAEVRSFGKFSAIALDVRAYDNASVKLNMDVFAVNLTLNDAAKASLAGTIDQGNIKYNNTSVLNTENLVAVKLVKTDVDAVKEGADFATL
ncbi:MAG TPA: DUF2807 domain-containing protein [Mucilaginibacter sp.]